MARYSLRCNWSVIFLEESFSLSLFWHILSLNFAPAYWKFPNSLYYPYSMYVMLKTANHHVNLKLKPLNRLFLTLKCCTKTWFTLTPYCTSSLLNPNIYYCTPLYIQKPTSSEFNITYNFNVDAPRTSPNSIQMFIFN